MNKWFACGATIVAVLFIYVWHIDSQAQLALQQQKWCNTMEGWSSHTCWQARQEECAKETEELHAKLGKKWKLISCP